MSEGKKAGIVALFGMTNVGKSTLVNTAVGESVSIVTPKPQTTRNVIRGICNREKGQVVFLDTPGVHRPSGSLGKRMNTMAFDALEGVDAVVAMFDASRPLDVDRRIVDVVGRTKVPKVIVLNKADMIKDKQRLLPMIEELSIKFPGVDIYPMSALKKEDVEGLLEMIFTLMPEGEPFFGEDVYTDLVEKQLAAEVIRKHVFMSLRQEIPYTTAVMVEEFREPRAEGEKLCISAVILIERESHKPIIIGKGGQGIKSIGVASRLELQRILGAKIDLRLFVKVKPDWTSNPSILRDLGIK